MRADGAHPDESTPDVSFGFRCKRSGRCCQVRGGIAWVDPIEQDAIATHMNLPVQSFRTKHTRELTDPRTGELRTALRDREDGACELLEAGNQCSVYEARPKQCRDFPYWDSVAGELASFERARAICPGIEAVPSPHFTDRVVHQLGQLMGTHAPAPTATCPHGEGGKLAQVSRLEFEAIANAQTSASNRPKTSGACPSFRDSLCTHPSAKPIACRELGEADRETLYAELQGLHRSHDYPHTTGSIGSFAAPDPGAKLTPLDAPSQTKG